MTTSAPRPNILFILADDLGIGDLACYGNPHLDTPVMDALATAGVRFLEYYTPSPLCAPARAALLTGRFNHRTGAIDVSSNRGIDRIALSEKTFGDYFRGAGYATALIGKWHNGLYCGDYLPHKRGFDLFYGFANGQMDYWKWNLQRNDRIETHDGRYMTDVFNEEAIRFIRGSLGEGKPFALFLAHHAPHAPLQAPQHLIDKYRARLGDPPDDTVPAIYAMIERMDSGLGGVFDELKRLGQWENTITVLTSDNGAYLLGNYARFHGVFRGNKDQVLEQGIRVPAIAAWPGVIPAGRTETAPVHGCDWLPTLFSLTGAAAPDGAKPLDGLNVMPLLSGHAMPGLAERQLPFQKNRYTPAAHSDGAIRQGRWKLFWPGEKTSTEKDIGRDNPSFERGSVCLPWEMPLDPDLPDYSGIRTGPPELYDLEADPGESLDLAGVHPDRVRALARGYDAWFAEIFAEWRRSNREIREHDAAYWKGRDIPDPRALFDGFWQWARCPGTDPERDDPLEVFKGYWSYPAPPEDSYPE